MIDVKLFSELVNVVTNSLKELLNDKEFRAFFCGYYSDGRVKSFRDAMTGEYLSPKQKKKSQKKKVKNKNTKFRL